MRQTLNLSNLPAAALLLTLALAVSLPCAAAGEPLPQASAALAEAEFRPALGKYYRPGAWLLVRAAARLPVATGGVYRPALEVYENDACAFSCMLAPQRLNGGERYVFSFWVIAGETRPALRLTLRGETAKLRAECAAGTLEPLPAGCGLAVNCFLPTPNRLRHADAAELPAHAALYESCDVLGVSGAAGSTPEQLSAVAEWVARGGVALFDFAGGWDRLRASAAASGLETGRESAFVLPGAADGEGRTLPALRLGRGLLLDLSGLRGNDAADALWKRLAQEVRPAAATDLRLARRRYAALPGGWPKPPAPEPETLLKWLASWTALCLAALALPAVRRSAWRAALSTSALGLALGAAFLSANPLPAAGMVAGAVRLAGEAGSDCPTFDEEIVLATPFRDGGDEGGLRLRFANLPPPRLLAWSGNELASAFAGVELRPEGGGVLRVSGRGGAAGPVRRGVPLLFSRKFVGERAAVPETLVTESATGLKLSPGGDAETLYGASLRTRGCRTHAATLNLAASANLPAAPDPAPLTAREKFAAALYGEHLPGRFAVVLGWETPKPDSAVELGSLRVFGLKNVLRQE